MIAVLVDAKKPGSSGWAAVRSSTKVRVSGLDCGQLLIEFKGNGSKIPSWNIFEDIFWDLPREAERVRAQLLHVDKGSRVFVNME